MQKHNTILWTCIFVCFSTGLFAQQIDPNDPAVVTLKKIFTDEEYKSADFGPARWLEDGCGYTTLEETDKFEEAMDIIKYNPVTGDRQVLVAADRLIPKGQDKPLKIDDYTWSDDGSKLLVFTNTERVWRRNTRGDYWVLILDTNKLFKLGGDFDESRLMFAKFSPDGTSVAFVYYNNIYIQNLATLKIKQLTKDGSNIIINGTSDWVNEEEFHLRDGFRFSPDGRFIAFRHFATTDVEEFKLINYTDSLYPKITSFKYPKVGRRNSACFIGVVSVKGSKARLFKSPGDPSDTYIPKMQWTEDSKHVVIQHLNRLQNTNRVMSATVKQDWFGQVIPGDFKTVFVDRDDAWLDVVGDLEWIDNGSGFIWLSERDGWKHIYRVSLSGNVKLISPGDYDVLNVQAIDENRGWIYFIASPDNPTQRYLYRIPLDGGKAQRITPCDQPGTHSYQISKDAKWAIHTYSAFGKPSVIDLVSLGDHKTARVLQDNAELREKIDAISKSEHEFFRVDIGEGILLDAWCIKPPDFDPSQKYPLLFYVYGEPAGQAVRDRWGGQNYLWYLMLAQQGYIVINVDNRGTPAPRGRAWRKCVYRQIGILATKEQALAAQKIIETYPYIDKDRVGIWGWSGGGSMTLNMMFHHPEIYKTGIAIAFVANQRYYDTIYQERYMGLPDDNENGFKNGSPITFAKQLQGNLLIVYGTGDDNCHFQNCQVLINELVKHNKHFTMMAYPNRTHSIKEGEGTTRHLYELLTKYLNDNLPAGAK